MTIVPLAELISPSGRRAGAGNTDIPVYSVTKHEGFVPSLEYFKKQVFSRDVSGYKLVELGDFAYATIHLDEGSVGVAPERALISPMYTVFKVDESRVLPEYLLRFMKSARALAEYSRIGRGAVHRRKSISLEALGSISIPLPAIDEQRRIAAILDRATEVGRTRERVMNSLDVLRDSVFESMFGSPSMWTSRWDEVSIGQVASAVDYGTAAKAGESGDYPILRMGNITDEGRIDASDIKFLDLDTADVDKYTTRRGDLLFNRTNSRDKVGKTGLVRTDDVYAIAGYLVRLRVSDLTVPEFVCAYLNGAHGRRIRRRLAKEAINQANISAGELKQIRMPLPPIELQVEFAGIMNRIESQRERILQQVIEDRRLASSLQARAFRGEL